MNKMFSLIRPGFYAQELRDDFIAAGTWPEDAIEVDSEAEAIIRAAMSRGDVVESDGAGGWSFSPAPPPPFAPVAAAYLNTVRGIREQVLNRLAGIGFASMHSGDEELSQATATARQSLLDITLASDVLGATDLDSLKAAVKSAYTAIIAAAPPVIREAFDPAAI
ncbi:hypothetical protein LE191_12475 [Janthinobacterium sp. HSC-3S05]|uniref:hypothetical protein n=1 Tax=Janthinobacterium lividum TaxID=29581 RepID=UPI001CD87F1F|nr:hypothetical protein [Janthinobacterium lividum]MCA1860918.1 hypothetical protein [Janthinobacterium lividum]